MMWVCLSRFSSTLIPLTSQGTGSDNEFERRYFSCAFFRPTFDDRQKEQGIYVQAAWNSDHTSQVTGYWEKRIDI